jgi:hypothetical protein
MTETPRGHRIGINEAMFRSVNERLESLNDTFEPVTQTFEVVCECGNIDCAMRFEMTHQAYEKLRTDPTLFAVVSGHEEPEYETVVSGTDRYVVVRKLPGGPAEAAAERDPRRGSS